MLPNFNVFLDQRHLNKRLSCFGTKVGGEAAQFMKQYQCRKVELIEKYAPTYHSSTSYFQGCVCRADVILGLRLWYSVTGHDVATGDRRTLGGLCGSCLVTGHDVGTGDRRILGDYVVDA